MNSIGWIRKTGLFAVLLISACHRGMGDGAEVAASILLNRFETIFYTKAGLLAASGGYRLLHERDADALRVPFAELQWGLDALGKSSSRQIMGSADAVLVGAKDFLSPNGLGSTNPQFCDVLVLGKRAPKLRGIFSASPVGSASGNAVWQWTAPAQEGHPKPYTFYMSEVSQSYILISNDLAEIQSIASNLISADRNTRSLGGVRDWEFVNHHDYWGYRRYRHEGRVGDQDETGTEDVTSTATSLVFAVDFWQRTGWLRVLASNGSTAERINSRISTTRSSLAPLRPSGTGAWETKVRFTGDDKAAESMFFLMGMFGFAVYL